MNAATGLILLAILVTGLALLGASRLAGALRLMAAQGVLVATLPLLARADAAGAGDWTLAVVTAAIKGLLFPALLRRALRDNHVSREIEPYVGPALSVLLGVAALGLSFRLAARWPLPPGLGDALVVPAGLFLMWTGLFLVCARRKAITQVIGFVVLENGVYALGAALVPGSFGLLEMGVLLDVLAGVFIMGIFVFHIGRQFEDLDASRMDQLQDGVP